MPEPDPTDATPDPVTLTRGGELTITPLNDGTYMLRIDAGGGHFMIMLNPADVQAIRTLTGDLVLAHLNAVSPAAREFMRLIEQDAS